MAPSLQDQFNRLVAQKERLWIQLQSCYDIREDIHTPSKLEIFKIRASALIEANEKFKVVTDELAVLGKSDDKFKVDVPSLVTQYDLLFYEIMAIHKRIEREEKAAERLVIQNPNLPNKIKLSRISIEPFDGQYEKFTAFIDLFDVLVHKNQEYSPIEKYSHLISSLRGPALAYIKTFEFSGDMYSVAYDSLVIRYTNIRIVGGYLLDKILNIDGLKSDSPSAIRKLTEQIEANIAAITRLEIDDLADFILLHLASRTLDKRTRSLFEEKVLGEDTPTVKDLLTFLRSRCTISSLIGDSSPKVTSTTPSLKEKRKVMTTTSSTDQKSPSTPSSKKRCLCDQNCSKFNQCPEFESASPIQRKDYVIQARRCFACLSPTHMLPKCASKFKCKICGDRTHHSSLHDAFATKLNYVTSSPSRSGISTNNPVPQINSLATSTPTVALLGTAQARIQGSDGTWHFVRLVLDMGSQANLIKTSLVERLGLPRRKCPYEVSGVGTSPNTRTQGIVSIRLAPLSNFSSIFSIDAAVLPKITNDLPSAPLSPKLAQRFSSLQLADPEFFKPSPIDLLLGVQAVMDLYPEESVQIKGTPCAVLTQLGWVILGAVPADAVPSTRASLSVITDSSSISQIDQNLTKFWEAEEISRPRNSSPDDRFCESYFQNTTIRLPSGRYQVRLPFKDNIRPTLGSTRQVALSRFLKLENRFSKDLAFHKSYVENLLEYLNFGHMARTSRPVDYVLTHHGVSKRTSAGLKTRVVFNPTERDSNSQSLNDSLLVGPKLQQDLGEVLNRFRTHQIPLTCDIKHMFRAIALHPDDRDYLHLFWRSSADVPIEEWELTTVTFGLVSSPFLALRTLLQLVKDEGSDLSLAADVILHASFVDDLLGGADSEDEAFELRRQLIELMKRGGFDLGKWATTSPSLLDGAPSEILELHDNTSGGVIKVLGMAWEPCSDNFLYKIDPSASAPTKRGILSRVARMFDVNGYISPVTFSMKVLLQRLWLAKLDWDDPLPPEIESTWLKLEAELPLIERVRIPRCILPKLRNKIQLIGFSDASSLGMCATLYIRVENDLDPKISLLKAKTKVAPLRSWTIPRLELGAALLLAKLIASSQGIISFLNINDIICFSDSTTTLGWISTPPFRLRTFVANRVVQIHELCPSAVWRYVKGVQNPADIGSRGCLPSDLLESNLWWNGPHFLKLTSSEWPQDHHSTLDPLPETKDPPQLCLSFTTHSIEPFIALSKRCSSLQKLQRVTTYVFRFAFNFMQKCRNKPQSEWKFGPVTASEYRTSLDFLIQASQQYYFKEDIALLKQNRPCSKRIQSLSPFLSPQGLLMVGGRLRNANLSLPTKHPLLIPRNSPLASLICDHFHLFSGHGGPQLVQSLIHRHYWIQSARSLIRQRIFKCLTCYRFVGKPPEPMMGDLPTVRVTPSRCFSKTGVDMAGPFMLKMNSRRNARLEKGYFAIFVCMATKAVHLECVSTLSTEDFLAAFDRFIGRRGLPSEVFSDQGRNFRGAARQISEIYNFLRESSSLISHSLSQREIIWHFNPPYAPHMGGLWEAGVKSTKFHLKRIVGAHHLTFEEFGTVLARIESILNSRPICTLSHSPSDSNDYLTPGHFLIGAPLIARPEVDLLDVPINRQTRWQLTRRMIQQFWKLWSRDYIHQLQQRPKWCTPSPTVTEGTLVLMKDPSISPTLWPLGRVERLISGADGVSRVAHIRTAQGVVMRHLNRIVALPLRDE